MSSAEHLNLDQDRAVLHGFERGQHTVTARAGGIPTGPHPAFRASSRFTRCSCSDHLRSSLAGENREVLALSTLTALPAGLLAHRLTGGQRGSSNLFASTAAGNFAAALVLASLSPLVALYYHTSTMLGAPLAILTGFLALGVGVGSGIRLMWRSQKVRKSLLAPTFVLLAVQLLAMLQFLHLASPILPEATVFEAGIEGALR